MLKQLYNSDTLLFFFIKTIAMIKNQNNSNQSVLDENAFFNNPILNSPYEIPTRHWELIDGQPTQRIVHSRRLADFVTPIPKARSQMKGVI